MTSNPAGFIWILAGIYFTLIGQGRLALPRKVRAWFDEEGRERYRVAMSTVGPMFLITGVALIFGLL